MKTFKECILTNISIYAFLSKQGQKFSLDTPERKIERRERKRENYYTNWYTQKKGTNWYTRKHDANWYTQKHDANWYTRIITYVSLHKSE